MPLFKKREEILDLTRLQKKGIIKNTPIEEETEYKDLSTSPKLPSSTPTGFDFLNSLARIPPIPEASKEIPNSNEETAHLNIKLDNFEYKLSQLADKLNLLEDSLNELKSQRT